MLTVLFVCTGNICRSPVAEGFLADRSERLLDRAVRARSAGTWGRAGDPPTEESVQMARERGVDISGLRSSPLTPAVIADADLVVGMTAEHVEEVIGLDAAAASKTFTLKELASILSAMPAAAGESAAGRIAHADRLRSREHAGNVRDPIGLSADVYRDVAWEIELGVDALVEGLFALDGRAEAAEG